jgi:hypothetical protein
MRHKREKVDGVWRVIYIFVSRGRDWASMWAWYAFCIVRGDDWIYWGIRMADVTFYCKPDCINNIKHHDLLTCPQQAKRMNCDSTGAVP